MIPPPSKSELVRWFLEAAKDYRRYEQFMR